MYDYDGSMGNNSNRSQSTRLEDRPIKVNENDELEIIEDDDEQMWKVNEITFFLFM